MRAEPMATADREATAGTVGKWLLAVVVPASAMAIGTLHAGTLIVVTLAAALSCALLWVDAPKRATPASRWVLIVVAALLGMTALQSIPLPATVVAALAQGNADVWARALSPLHEAGPSWHPISLAPPATHIEILKGVLYTCVFFGALRVTFSEGGSTFLQRVVIASASLLALTSLAHAATHAGRVFGFYTPHDQLGFELGRLGPLLNPNHVAAYLNVGAVVAMHAALARRDRAVLPITLVLGAILLLAGTSVWAGSRGGTASLVVATLLVGGLHLLEKRYSRGNAEAGIVAAALVAAGVLLGLGASEVARADLTDRDLSKFALARSALGLVRSAPIFGVGRGAFETAYPVLYEGNSYVSFRAVENVAVQWVVEWGAPVGILALVTLAITLRPKVLFGAAHPPIGVWAAVAVAVLHDVVDFHLEIPGVVVLVTVCVAVVVGARPERRERRPAPRRIVHLRWAALAMPVLALASVAVVLANIGHSLLEDRDRIARDAVDPSLGADAFRERARSMMLRYPAEPFLPLAGAIRAQASGQESVVPWIARALERYPAFGRAHLVLARSLGRQHLAQARLEYRLAYRWDARLRPAIAAEATGLVLDFDSALELVPDGPASAELLESLAAALLQRLPATSVRVDAELTKRDPTAKGPLRREIDAAISDLENGHPWCLDKTSCMAHAIASARSLLAREGNGCPPAIMLAKLRIAAGETDQALDELARAAETASDRATCLRSLVELSLQTGDRRRADHALDLALRSGCGARDECSRLFAWAASTVEARGSYVRAIALYKRAAEADPDNADAPLQRAAELAERLGLNAEALDAYDRLARRHPEQPQWRAKADEVRAKQFQAPPR